MNDTSNDYYYAHDHLYSTAALTDSAGDVIERYEGACPERSRRNAYGNVHIMDGNYNSRSSTLYDNPYTFTGRRLDSLDSGKLNIMYYRHRSYIPEIGRYLTNDRLGYIEGLNMYAYTRNDPLRHTDPFGDTLVIIPPPPNEPDDPWIYDPPGPPIVIIFPEEPPCFKGPGIPPIGLPLSSPVSSCSNTEICLSQCSNFPVEPIYEPTAGLPPAYPEGWHRYPCRPFEDELYDYIRESLAWSLETSIKAGIRCIRLPGKYGDPIKWFVADLVAEIADDGGWTIYDPNWGWGPNGAYLIKHPNNDQNNNGNCCCQ
jgi:RHS repeat-associated protein